MEVVWSVGGLSVEYKLKKMVYISIESIGILNFFKEQYCSVKLALQVDYLWRHDHLITPELPQEGLFFCTRN